MVMLEYLQGQIFGYSEKKKDAVRKIQALQAAQNIIEDCKDNTESIRGSVVCSYDHATWKGHTWEEGEGKLDDCAEAIGKQGWIHQYGVYKSLDNVSDAMGMDIAHWKSERDRNGSLLEQTKVAFHSYELEEAAKNAFN